MKWLIIGLIFIVLGGGLFFVLHKSSDDIASACQLDELAQAAELQTDERSFTLYVAETPAERAQGLSDCRELPAGTGLLFIFPQAGTHSFWMKDMHFAIDIVWLDEDFQVVGLKDDAQPESFPQAFAGDSESVHSEPVESAKNAIYVGEFSADFIESHDVKIGDVFEINLPARNS